MTAASTANSASTRWAKQRVEFSYGNDHKDAIAYLGLILVRLAFRTFSDNLLHLLTLAYGDRLFSLKHPTGPQTGALKVSKVLEIKLFKYLKVTNELKAEHCCFFHFLLGKRRTMSTRNELEVP